MGFIKEFKRAYAEETAKQQRDPSAYVEQLRAEAKQREQQLAEARKRRRSSDASNTEIAIAATSFLS